MDHLLKIRKMKYSIENSLPETEIKLSKCIQHVEKAKNLKSQKESDEKQPNPLSMAIKKGSMK